MISGRFKENASSVYFEGGLAYNYSTQTYGVTWPGSSKIVQDQFQTHEFLFDAGCVVKYTFTKLSIGALLLFQGGPNFTWTTDQHTRIPVYHSVFRKSKYFKWEYMQLYGAPGLQVQYAIDEDINIQCNVMPRFLLYREILMEDYLDPVRFNYAAVKINVSVGLQIRIMR
jgi:hypothetical protein